MRWSTAAVRSALPPLGVRGAPETATAIRSAATACIASSGALAGRLRPAAFQAAPETSAATTTVPTRRRPALLGPAVPLAAVPTAPSADINHRQARHPASRAWRANMRAAPHQLTATTAPRGGRTAPPRALRRVSASSVCLGGTRVRAGRRPARFARPGGSGAAPAARLRPSAAHAEQAGSCLQPMSKGLRPASPAPRGGPMPFPRALRRVSVLHALQDVSREPPGRVVARPAAPEDSMAARR